MNPMMAARAYAATQGAAAPSAAGGNVAPAGGSEFSNILSR
ncbi:hypothetical protein [Brevundimonas denitrificans]